MNRTMYLILIISLVLVGCTDNHETQSVIDLEEEETISVTQYSDRTEIFMEYPEIIIQNEIEFLIHLTELKTFKAVKVGALSVNFTNDNGTQLSTNLDKPARDGIYLASVNFSESGNYKMEIILEGKQVSDKIVVNNIEVFNNHDDIDHANHEENDSHISFLKEQQWKIDFSNKPVGKREMQKFVVATGELEAKPSLFSKVVSPIQGVVLTKNNQNLVTIGSYVKRGDNLLNISPSADITGNIQKIKSDYLLANSAYQREKILFKKEISTEINLDEAKFDYESKRAIYNSLVDQIKITDNGYSVIAPIDGYIEAINFDLGEQLESGQELLTILNSSKIILKANVPAPYFYLANSITDACFKPEGMRTEFTISELNGKKLSVAAKINSQNRTIPVYFEFNNPNNKLHVGMFTEVHLGVETAQSYIAIPESAVVNEEGLKTAYVQVEGESFEKRILKIGIIDAGYVQILDGLKVGERVVTEGAYQVRLAELSNDSSIGHGHGH